MSPRTTHPHLEMRALDQRFELRFSVNGKPAPKGSATKGPRGQIRVRTDGVIAWESTVAQGAVVAMQRAGHRAPTSKQALRAFVVFRFARPDGHYVPGSIAIRMPELKASAPTNHAVPPDLDKLLRSTLDAMTGIVYDDDSRVCEVRARKRYVDVGEFPGADISVEAVRS